jgi:uncharacterized protein
VSNEPRFDIPVLELPLVNLPKAHPCAGCGDCCTYVATQIDDPHTFAQYENVHWYLTHENVGVYIDFDGDWYIEFQTKCRHLTAEKTCDIYETRPLVCSEFSFLDCERNTGEQAWKYYFKSQEDLVEFLRTKRPRAYERYQRKRRELLQKRKASVRGQRTEARSGRR